MSLYPCLWEISDSENIVSYLIETQWRMMASANLSSAGSSKGSLPFRHQSIIRTRAEVRATRCRYRPRAWVWVRLAWPGSAEQGIPRRRQARQAVALLSARQDEKGVPWFWKILYVQLIVPFGRRQLNQHEYNLSIIKSITRYFWKTIKSS